MSVSLRSIKLMAGKFLGTAALISGIAVPACGMLAETSLAATLDLPTGDTLTLQTDPSVFEERASASPAAALARAASADQAVDADLECMAKVVHHEAGNQSREGQLAVAQLMMNRLESGRFGETLCDVADQPGQFFDTAAYTPRHDARWDMALSVAREARDGISAEVVPGALFYHASAQAAPRFFRSRIRVATLGDHVFYR